MNIFTPSLQRRNSPQYEFFSKKIKKKSHLVLQLAHYIENKEKISMRKILQALTILLISAVLESATAQENGKTVHPVPVKAEVKNDGGAPRLFINGKPQPVLICREHWPEKAEKIAYLKKAVANGVNIVWYALSPPLSSETSSNSFRIIDRNIGEVLKQIPDTYILLQFCTDIYTEKRTEWCKKYPDEVMVWPPKMEKGNRVSTASKIWRETTVRGLKELVKHIRNSPYADKVLGGVICGGNGEWLDYWDYSKPAQKAFGEWLKVKYNNDLFALRKAWNNDKVDFENVTLPEWKSLFEADMGLFWDPLKSRKKIDYLYYYHEIQAEAISAFAKAIKEASNGEMITGAWHGGFFTPGWSEPEKDVQRARHQAFGKLVRDPNVDFFLTPYAYREREAGGVYHSSFIHDSIVLHGKMAFSEDDTRTLLTNAHPKYGTVEKVGDNFGEAKNLEDSISILKRNFAGIFSKPGSGIIWFSLGQGLWFDHPEIIKTFSVFKEIADKLIGKDKKRSEIAVVVSKKSLYYQKLNLFTGSLVGAQMVEGLCRLGAPYDVYEDLDLTSSNFPYANYKLYIFLNTFHFSDKEKTSINEKIKAGGNTVLWITCPGIVEDKGLSVKAVSELVGMEIEHLDPQYEFGTDVNIINYAHQITNGLPTNTRYGTEHFDKNNILVPVFWCSDRNVEILGELAATAPNVLTFRKPGLCVKKFDNWTSIWSGAPNLPSTLLRNIARNVGVHIYDTGDDQVFASEILLAVNARYAGERTIKLPGKYNVYDPFKKEYIAKDAESFKCYINAKDTMIWLLEK